MKKILSLLLTLLFCCCIIFMNVTAAEADETGNIIILYTNDVHCALDMNIGYAGLSACKKNLEAEGNTVILVDNGDAVQGDSLGTLTKGDAIIRIMNEVGYDLAIPGNHDFDFGVEQFLHYAEEADFPYLACNFMDLRTGKTVLEPYKILEAGRKKIAFIGVNTPATLVSSTPVYFQNEAGEYIYSFCGNDDGEELYSTVQNAVDSARAEGADYCILLSHLGIDSYYSPYMSTEVITHTTGIDAVLDGHSHSTVEQERVRNAQGNRVLVSQAGTQFSAIGKLTIDPAGNMKTELITEYEDKDPAITALIEKERDALTDLLQEVIGTTDFDLIAIEENKEIVLVRNNETNLGDFIADAYRYVTGAEIAVTNAGSAILW